MEKNVVIVGAGVAGLTSAILLCRNPQYKITVAARFMPGDYDIEYASPWAGANFFPVSVNGTRAAEWDAKTWPYLQDLAQNHPEAGVHFQGAEISYRKKDIGSATADWFAGLLSTEPWWKDVVPDFRLHSKSELQSGIDSATSFTSVCINTAIYLPWLVSQCLKNGIVFKRAVFKNITDAAAPGVHHTGKSADLVMNCTGLGALKLGGVEDKLVYPARGQIVVVRNEADKMYGISGTNDGSEEIMYIMTRAAGGGTVLGGCYQRDNWESQHDPSLAIRIMKRCVEACPALTGGKGIEHLDIIRHGVGLRPARDGGARIEKDRVNGVALVHSYGFGGAGYQCSWGAAEAAVTLVNEILSEKAKL